MTGLIGSVKKQLLTLMRDKGSAFTVFLAPILVVLLVGLAYSTSGQSALVVGVLEEGSVDQRFLDAIDTVDVDTALVQSRDACDERIRRGVYAGCVVLNPAGTGVLNATIIVDSSREELATTLRARLATSIGQETSEVRGEAVRSRQQRLRSLQEQLTAEVERVTSHVELLRSTQDELNTVATQLGSVEGSDEELSSGDVSVALDDVENTVSDLESAGESITASADAFLTATGNTSDPDEYGALDNDTDTLQTVLSQDVSGDVEALREAVGDVEDAVSSLQDDYTATLSTVETQRAAIQSLSSDVDDAISQGERTASTLRSALSVLSDLTGVSTEEIANPVTTSVEQVGNDSFLGLGSTTPYLLSLGTFFFSLLLGGALMFTQQVGPASFREKVVPVNPVFRVFATVVSGFLISSVQTVVTLTVALYYLGLWDAVNYAPLLSTVFVGILWSLGIGMVLGQMFRSMQGLLLGALSVGSVVIFFSSFIGPVEQMSSLVQRVAAYNPFVLLSESFREIFFFEATLGDLRVQVAILFLVFLGACMLTVIGQWRHDSDTLSVPGRNRSAFIVGLVEADSKEAVRRVVEQASVYTLLREQKRLKKCLENVGVEPPVLLVSPKQIV
jgi:ABC-type polysaccharide/polyol phosphate export permease/predicted  nucleic acid-binding Zn-ribbon protein